jgi:hypothetical protein
VLKTCHRIETVVTAVVVIMVVAVRIIPARGQGGIRPDQGHLLLVGQRQELGVIPWHIAAHEREYRVLVHEVSGGPYDGIISRTPGTYHEFEFAAVHAACGVDGAEVGLYHVAHGVPESRVFSFHR